MSFLQVKLTPSHAVSLLQAGSSFSGHPSPPIYPVRPHTWDHHPTLPFQDVQTRTKTLSPTFWASHFRQ